MELELSDFHLPTALDSALTLVRERAGRRGVALHVSVDERLGQIQADERKIRQVVLNLLSNAIKFTPEGGRIEVAAVAKDGFVEVSVSDTGVGIAPEDQEAAPIIAIMGSDAASWNRSRTQPSRARRSASPGPDAFVTTT